MAGQAYQYETDVAVENCPLSWSFAVSVADNAGDSGVITLGQSPDATSSLDLACGEQEQPPGPPANLFDARFTGQNLPGVDLGEGTRTDIRPDDVPTGSSVGPTAPNAPAVWRVEIQSRNYPVTFSWDYEALADSLPGRPVQLVDGVTGGNRVSVNMREVGMATVADSTLTAVEIRLDQQTRRAIPVVSGWSLVSVPLSIPNPTLGNVLPPCSSGFLYEPGQGYDQIAEDDSVLPGRGFFANCSDGPVEVGGTAPDTQSVAVTEGWNVVGPFAEPVSVTAIATDPPGLVATPFFAFDSVAGYAPSDTLRPGSGYWVKTSQSGTLDFSGKSANRAALVASEGSSEATPTARLAFTDAAGHRTTLRLGTDVPEAVLRDQVLPPAPPSALFDVRFTTGRSMASVSPKGEGEMALRAVELQGVQYPMTLRIESPAGENSSVRVHTDGSGPSRLTPETPSVTFTTQPSALRVGFETTPTEFALEKSVPNPVARSATIPYAVPEATVVTIDIYDLLGRRVAQFVNGPKQPGRHRVQLDATQFPSGAYFVRMRAGKFSKTRRFTVVR